MTKVSTHVEFYRGAEGPLFRITRTPEQIRAHILFIAPLFEQANQTRHHITRSAINAYHQGMQSIVFDHSGTGDSGGELIDASLTLWQQDILSQISEIKADSSQAIFLSLSLSAVLLLSDEIISNVDAVILLQPDFNGKRFVQQFKRLALVAELTQYDNSQNKNVGEKQVIEVAGYQMQSNLLVDLAGQSLNKLADSSVDFYWFEWQATDEELSPGRVKQQASFVSKNNKCHIQQVADVKFWQATELQVAQLFLTQEQLVFSQLLTFNVEIN